MSLNEEEDEGPSNQSAGPRKIREELVYVTPMSLNNIARQVNDLINILNTCFGELTKEVDRLYFKLNTLQQSVIQLTDGITQDDPNEGVSLQVRKSKRIFQNTAFQSQQVYSSKSVKRYGKHDSCVQTSSLTMPGSYCQDGRESLKICPVSYSEGEEQKGGMVKQKKKHLDYPYEPKCVPQGQLIEDNITVDHIIDACGETSHSHVDQSAENSFCTFPFSEISKRLTRTVGKVLSSPLQQPMHGAGDVKNSHTYVNYGTGMGEDLQPQSRTRLKTEVFVSPTAPNSPPPLPPDWLAVLRASKRTSISSVMHSLTSLTPTVFSDPAASPPPDCLQTTPDTALLIASPETDFSPPTPEPFQYYELIPDDLVPQSEDQEMPPPLSPPVTSPRIQSRAAVTDLNDSASDVQSPRSSVPSRLILSLPPPPRYVVPSTSRSSIAPLPRSSTPQTLQSSIPLSSVSSYPQTSVSLIPSSKPSVAQLPRCSVAQPSRCLDTQSSRSSFAQPTGHLTTPQPRSCKTKEQCTPKVKMEIPKNKESHLLIRCKAMGYSSDISDSETDWMEEE
ncbi:wiskott-Aldrich syndrome protein family member 1-like [Oryx dammah]|uniref:wiskott-Aldrich syndrome protein family member 1-like n=1 Tax=Oryx dammah TaxID=59534 RepID=UPI001A9B3626|nr:wiskott-Aldrich syndrome protein family member 1-like [Oryx dammah]